jgi:hypothetical protein
MAEKNRAKTFRFTLVLSLKIVFQMFTCDVWGPMTVWFNHMLTSGLNFDLGFIITDSLLGTFFID